MEIDTNWCGCGRAIQSPVFGSYCSPACEARDRSQFVAQQRPHRSPRPGQPSGLDLDREDRSAPVYGRSTHTSIDRWRRQIQPLEGKDARHSSGTPASSVASTSALPSPVWPPSPRHAGFVLPSRRPYYQHQQQQQQQHYLDCLPSLCGESLSPPQTAALTVDEESIPTPPSRSEVDQPLAIYNPDARSSGLSHSIRKITRQLMSPPRPAVVSTSYDEVVSRSPGKLDFVRAQRSPAVAIPIPARQPSPHKGHFVYRPRPDSDDDADDFDSAPSFRAAPIVSRARPPF